MISPFDTIKVHTPSKASVPFDGNTSLGQDDLAFGNFQPFMNLKGWLIFYALVSHFYCIDDIPF